MSTSDDEGKSDGAAHEELRMLDALKARPAAKEPVRRDKIRAWLDGLSEEDFWRIRNSQELSDALAARPDALITIRTKAALGEIIRELGIDPANFSAAVERAAPSEEDQRVDSSSNVVPLRRGPPRNS